MRNGMDVMGNEAIAAEFKENDSFILAAPSVP